MLEIAGGIIIAVLVIVFTLAFWPVFLVIALGLLALAVVIGVGVALFHVPDLYDAYGVLGVLAFMALAVVVGVILDHVTGRLDG